MMGRDPTAEYRRMQQEGYQKVLDTLEEIGDDAWKYAVFLGALYIPGPEDVILVAMVAGSKFVRVGGAWKQVDKADEITDAKSAQKAWEKGDDVTDAKTLKALTEEQHHLLPQKHKKFFEERGINIEDHTMPMARSNHRLKSGPGLHTNDGGNWNKVWKEWIEDNPKATKEEVLEQLEKMKEEFDLVENAKNPCPT